jgi:hypothetical protein
LRGVNAAEQMLRRRACWAPPTNIICRRMTSAKGFHDRQFEAVEKLLGGSAVSRTIHQDRKGSQDSW